VCCLVCFVSFFLPSIFLRLNGRVGNNSRKSSFPSPPLIPPLSFDEDCRSRETLHEKTKKKKEKKRNIYITTKPLTDNLSKSI
jgi:hypothetical protein